MSPKLDADEWRRVFRRLADELRPDSQRHVMLIGGVAMALGYGSRRTTGDADAVMPANVAVDVLAAAAKIADEFQLPAGWLNQKAVDAGLITPPQSPGREVLRTPALVLEIPDVDHMLAMKVARLAGDTDIEDAEILLRVLHLTEVEDVWTRIGGLIPVARRERARDNLLRLWEDLDGPS